MRPYSLDEHWDLLTLRYQERGCRVPWRWRLLYRIVCRLIAWGTR
jgi:hypothetical protein